MGGLALLNKRTNVHKGNFMPHVSDGMSVACGITMLPVWNWAMADIADKYYVRKWQAYDGDGYRRLDRAFYNRICKKCKNKSKWNIRAQNVYVSIVVWNFCYYLVTVGNISNSITYTYIQLLCCCCCHGFKSV